MAFAASVRVRKATGAKTGCGAESVRELPAWAMDGAGNVNVADGDNHRARRIDTNGIITAAADNGTKGIAGDGGVATSAKLNCPEDVKIDVAGNLLAADTGNNRIRKVDITRNISTVAGTAENRFSGDGGLAIQAEVSFPWGATTDPTVSIYIGDRSNNRVRAVYESLNGTPTIGASSTVSAASITLAAQ
jgi:hypothetical protein